MTRPHSSAQLKASGQGPGRTQVYLAGQSPTSKGMRHANAEEWFNDSNVNAAHAPHTPFINSTFARVGPRPSRRGS